MVSVLSAATEILDAEMASFDTEAAIAELLADDSRASLELPHMTTGQRKHARKLADLYPELKCESYGFGAERQLYIFKKSLGAKAHSTPLKRVVDKAKAKIEAARNADETQTQAARVVSVKNTFIDDWVGGATPAEPIMFRSMPPQLPPNIPTVLEEEADILPPPNREPSFLMLDQYLFAESVESADCSTAASGSSTAVVSPASSNRDVQRPGSAASVDLLDTPPASVDLPCGPPPGLMLPPGLEVRNTFIHHVDGSYDVPERVIQSMPHGMFGRSLQHEYAQAAQSAAAVAADDLLCTGTEVTIDGLIKAPAFNGASGTVEAYDAETERYSILLAQPAVGHKVAKVKRQNLRTVLPLLPPSFGCCPAWIGSAAASKPPLRLTGLI